MDFQPGQNGVGGQRGGIGQPGVGDGFLQLEEVPLAQFPPPKFPQGTQPEEGKPEFFFQKRFEGWSDADAGASGGDQPRGGRDIGEVKEFEEAVDVLLPGKPGGGQAAIHDPPMLGGKPGVKPGGEPLHFGPVGGGLLGDDDVRAAGGDGPESLHHPRRAAQDIVAQCGIGGIEPGGEADAAGDAVKFADGETVLGKDKVGPDDGGEFLAPLPGEFHQFGRFAPVEQFGDPAGLLPLDALEIELVAGAHEELEPVAEFLQGVGKNARNGERLRRHEPFFAVEKPGFGSRSPNKIDFLYNPGRHYVFRYRTAAAKTQAAALNQPLEGQANEVFHGGGRSGVSQSRFDGGVGVGLFVAQGKEGQDGVVEAQGVGAGGVLGGGDLPGGGDAEFVFQFEHDALGGFLADAGDFGEEAAVAVDDGGLEVAHAHAAQDGQPELGADAGDVVDEEAEEVALGGGHEAIEDVGVFAHLQMRQNPDRLAIGREFVKTRQGDEHLVADAMNIDNDLRRERLA